MVKCPNATKTRESINLLKNYNYLFFLEKNVLILLKFYLYMMEQLLYYLSLVAIKFRVCGTTESNNINKNIVLIYHSEFIFRLNFYHQATLIVIFIYVIGLVFKDIPNSE